MTKRYHGQSSRNFSSARGGATLYRLPLRRAPTALSVATWKPNRSRGIAWAVREEEGHTDLVLIVYEIAGQV